MISAIPNSYQQYSGSHECPYTYSSTQDKHILPVREKKNDKLNRFLIGLNKESGKVQQRKCISGECAAELGHILYRAARIRLFVAILTCISLIQKH